MRRLVLSLKISRLLRGSASLALSALSSCCIPGCCAAREPPHNELRKWHKSLPCASNQTELLFLRSTSLRKKFLPLLILIIVALCPVCVLAQQNSATSQAKDAAEEALRDKAYVLLETLAGQLNTMQSPENRARIGSNIAWSLWPHNEARARELLTMVQQDINAGLQVTETDDPEDVHTLLIFLRLRTDTINRIAKYDPELAYDFFKGTPLSPDLKLSDEAKAGEQALEIELAKQVAASSPELALQLARKVLARGFSDDLR